MLVDLPAEANLTEAAHVTSDSHRRHKLDILGCLFRFFHPADDIFDFSRDAFIFYELDGHLAGGDSHVEYLRFANRYIILLSVNINGYVARWLHTQEKQLSDVMKQSTQKCAVYDV